MLPIIVIILTVAALFSWWIILLYRNRIIPLAEKQEPVEDKYEFHKDRTNDEDHDLCLVDVATNAYGIYGND